MNLREMILTAVKYSLILVLGLIIVITMRITVPTVLAYDEQLLFNQTKFLVIRVYMSLTSVIVLEMLLIYLSVSVLYVTNDWIAVLYLPLLVYAMQHTHATCVAYLAKLISEEKALNFLSEHWLRYFEHGDQFWTQIQTKLSCCGLEGPRTYLENLRKVPPSCFADTHKGHALIVRGCKNVVYDHFNAVKLLSKGLSWLALTLQFVMFVLYVGVIIKKCFNTLCPSWRFRICKH